MVFVAVGTGRLWSLINDWLTNKYIQHLNILGVLSDKFVQENGQYVKRIVHSEQLTNQGPWREH